MAGRADDARYERGRRSGLRAVCVYGRGASGSMNRFLEEEATARSRKSEVDVSWTLFGTICMMSALVMLVNGCSERLAKVMWKILTGAISIFCAVLITFCLHDLMLLMAGKGEMVAHHRRLSFSSSSAVLDGGNPPRRLAGKASDEDLIISFLLFFGAYVLIETALLYIKKLPAWLRPDLQLAAWGLIGAHMIGFCAVEAYGSLQTIQPGVGWCIAVVFIAIGSFVVMCVLFALIRWMVVNMDSEICKGDDAFELQCEHTEHEFIAFALGFLMSVVMRYFVIEKLPDLHAVPKGRTDEDIMLLFIFMVMFTVVVIFISILEHTCNSKLNRLAHRFFAILELTAAMTMGWCLCFLGKWAFWYHTDGQGWNGQGDVTGGRLAMVLLFTIGSFFSVAVLDWFSSKCACLEAALDALSQSFVLNIGLAYEGLFMSAFDDVGYQYNDDSTRKVLATSAIACAVCAIVIPPWVLYILPHSIQGNAEPQQPRGGAAPPAKADRGEVDELQHAIAVIRHEVATLTLLREEAMYPKSDDNKVIVNDGWPTHDGVEQQEDDSRSASPKKRTGSVGSGSEKRRIADGPRRPPGTRFLSTTDEFQDKFGSRRTPKPKRKAKAKSKRGPSNGLEGAGSSSPNGQVMGRSS